MRWSIPSLFSRPKTAAKKRAPHRNPLRLELLEDRLTPAGFFLTGVGGLTNPAEPNARIYDSTNPAGGSSSFLQPPGDIGSFPGFAGSVRVASGDINGDGIDDIVTAQGSGAGSGSQIRVFDGASAMFSGTRVEISSFFAYSDSAGASTNPGFGGGVFVACADFNGDGRAELVTSAGAGARGHVKVFNFNVGGVFQGNTPELRASFFAYTDFAGEIRVTTLKAGATTFLVTASGAGTTQSDVRFYQNVFTLGQIPDLTFIAPAAQFFPIPGYTGGLSVAAGDTDGDGIAELFVAKNSGESTVLVIDAITLTTRASFTAFGGFNGEVRLGAADIDGDGKVEVLTSTGTSPGAGGAHVKAWSTTGAAATTTRSFFAYEGYINGVFLNTNDFRWAQTFVNTTAVAIPDNNPAYTVSNLVVNPITNDDTALQVKSITLALRVNGTFDADLDIFLQSPVGSFLRLTNRNNGNSDGYVVTLTDAATTNIAAAGVVATGIVGTFKPEGGVGASFSASFSGQAVAGTWKLFIRDTTGGDLHTLVSWGLRFNF